MAGNDNIWSLSQRKCRLVLQSTWNVNFNSFFCSLNSRKNISNELELDEKNISNELKLAEKAFPQNRAFEFWMRYEMCAWIQSNDLPINIW